MPQNTWPFTFAETVTIIGLLTTSVISIISQLKIDKVHTIVNSHATKQEQKIVDLQTALTSEMNVNKIADQIRLKLAEDVKGAVAIALKKSEI